MAYNTGKPIPSRDPRDLIDNAESFDIRATSREARATPDRLGVPRKTWYGMEQDFAEFLAASGFEPAHLTYQDGVALQVDRPTQLIDYSGSVYRVKMPANFPVPLSGTWADDSALLVDVGDQSLRDDLAKAGSAFSGSQIVGWSRLPLSAAISNVEGFLSAQLVNVWEFVNLISDKPSPADPSTWDWTPALQAALDTGKSIRIPSGNYRISSSVNVATTGQRIIGDGWASAGGGAVTQIFSDLDITMFRVTASFVKFECMFLNNTAPSMNKPHIHFINDGFSGVEYCRFSAQGNVTATGGGIVMDNGAGGYGGSVGVINNINISHGSIIVRRSDVHIKNSWIWCNTRPFGIYASPLSGNLVIEGCDLLPPVMGVAGRKAAVWLSGAMKAPRLLGCNFDGNLTIETGSGLLAENGVINLLVSGCYGFGHNEDCIILDSVIAPTIIGNTFEGNNLGGTGASDITLRSTFPQNLEKPRVQGNTFTQDSAKVGTPGPAIKVPAGTYRNGMMIVDNTIQQPGAGGGYTDVEILLEDGPFANESAGSLRGNRGQRTRYSNSGMVTVAANDAFETINYGVPLAYAPRPDQIKLSFVSTSTGVSDYRFNKSGLPTTTSMQLGFSATHPEFDLYWQVEL